MKAITRVIAAMLCVLCMACAAQADYVKLAGENVFCNKFFIRAGDEAVVTTPCVEYDTLRAQTMTDILNLITELKDSYDIVDEKEMSQKLVLLGNALDSSLLGVETVFWKLYGEEGLEEQTEFFEHESDLNRKAIRAYEALIVDLTRASNAWRTLEDAYFELEGKFQQLAEYGRLVDKTARPLIKRMESYPDSSLQSLQDDGYSESDVRFMWAQATTITKTLENFEEEYRKVVDNNDPESFQFNSEIDELLTLLAQDPRGKDWEELYNLSRDDRNEIGEAFKSSHQDLADMYASAFDKSLYGCFLELTQVWGIWNTTDPYDKIQTVFLWYMGKS